MDKDIRALTEKVKKESVLTETIRQEVGRVIVGQSQLVDGLLIGLLADGHVLLEGVPGLAKTLTIRTLAQCLDAHFQRLQFTPDLLPADLIGTMIYNPRGEGFTVKKGPVFANLILADEINRAPAKVQSALLEAMQERQVTISDKTYPLEQPFLVMATQNPIEQQGTYPLPEAQVDRFLLKIKIGYPSREEEKEILRRMTGGEPPQVRQTVSVKDLLKARKLVEQIYVDEKMQNYIVDLVFATREPEAAGLKELKPLIAYGASPRATLGLTTAAKALAFLSGRGFITPEDVKTVGPDVLRHRIIVTYEAEAEQITSENVVQSVFDGVEVP
ncbi:MAG: MoxR family ATPase [candidate division FCPU426 bacterium]